MRDHLTADEPLLEESIRQSDHTLALNTLGVQKWIVLFFSSPHMDPVIANLQPVQIVVTQGSGCPIIPV